MCVALVLAFVKLGTTLKTGGHNGAGLALVENGLVIDLSEMKSIPRSLTKRGRRLGI
jgi:hypothetical protein